MNEIFWYVMLTYVLAATGYGAGLMLKLSPMYAKLHGFGVMLNTPQNPQYVREMGHLISTLMEPIYFLVMVTGALWLPFYLATRIRIKVYQRGSHRLQDIEFWKMVDSVAR